ncbi:PLxRFG domain-containing protein [Deefgea sp. CFH1-16]|uniref:PLxRFG domain-containing protein n=1 Tax=Deefgea sp. CFH1-16 TaxID=2675457 RepID=UPI0015F64E46|nr:PLxRFG domain-containing protein [Deefgea sp. CFH1-16]MBM5575844.1 PLxRFG domain-containing protein [Deefgea sp. CFH1-16]
MDKLRDEFDKRKEDGIYFPLARFGKYVITADGNQIVMRAETQTEADEVTAWLQQQGYADAKNNEESVRLDANRSVSPQFVKEMHDNITGKLGEDSPTAQAMLDELNQLFIEYLPNQSSRKNMIHRKNKAGYSNDIMRSFARTTSNMARDIANLEYSHQVGEALRDAEKEGRKLASTDEQREARKVINHLYELEKDELTHQDSSFVRKANGLGFLATMAWNLSSGLVNLSQAPILGFPMLATRFGDAATMREMMKSFTTTLKSGRFDAYLFDSTRGLDANSDEYKALKELETLGKRDMSAMMEIQNASSRASATLNSNADRWQRIVDAGSIFQRASELMNRDTIAIAGYRLARKGSNTVAPMSHSAAVDYLAKVLDETQFDYSRQNKAGMQRSNTGQFILLFLKPMRLIILI